MTEKRKTAELRQHPTSLEVYGADESVSDLVASIREHGILSPLIIKPDGTILSGHRRYRAALELGLEEVPCVTANPESAEDESVFIVEANKTRTKSAAQLLNEGRRLKEVLEVLSKRRGFSNLKNSLIATKNETSLGEVTVTSPRNGEKKPRVTNPTRKAVASALGVKENVWKNLTYLGDLADIGNEAATEALAKVNSGEMSLNKAVCEVRRSLRESAEETEAEEQREPAFLDVCHAEAARHTEALRVILTSVINAPDDDFNFVPWQSYSEDLEGVLNCSRLLDDKISRKTRKVMNEMRKEVAA